MFIRRAFTVFLEVQSEAAAAPARRRLDARLALVLRGWRRSDFAK